MADTGTWDVRRILEWTTSFFKRKDVDPDIHKESPGEWYKGSWHSWHESAWRMHQFFVPVSPSTVFLANYKRLKEQAEPAPEASTDITSSKKKPSSSTSSKGGKSSSSSLQPPLPRSFYSIAGDALAQPRYRVFGMTARILVDASRVAYGEEPEYEHNSHFGDEEMMDRLLKIGRLSPIKKDGEILTRDVMMKAAKANL